MESIKERLHSLLRKSESVFKTDMVYLVRGGLWLTTLQVVSSLSSFILAVGFARFLSKDAYGTYKYIMSVGAILAAFSLTGLSTVVTNAAARGQDGTLRFAFRKNLLWGLLTLLVFAGSSGYYFLHSNTLLGWGLLIIGIITPLLGSASLSDAFFTGKKDFKKSAITSGIAVFFTNLATLLTAFFTHNILAIVATYMISSIVLELGIYIYAVRVYSPHSQEIDPDALSYGAHLSFIGIFNILVDRLDSIFAFHFLGPAELAVYAFAIAMPEQIKGFSKTASVLALPKFSASTSISFKDIMRKMLVMFLGVSAVVAVYIALAPLIFRIFFPQYLGSSVGFSRAYALSLIAVVNVLPITYLQAVSAKRELYFFNITSGIIQIAAMGLGTMLYGLWGLIIGIGLSRLFRLWYSIELIRRHNRSMPVIRTTS